MSRIWNSTLFRYVGLAPGGPLRRFSPKGREAQRIEAKWKLEFGVCCWVCASPVFDCAHLAPGIARLPKPALFCALCRKHHDVYDGRNNDLPAISKGAMIGLKLVFDPGNYSTVILSEALGFKNGYLGPEWELEELPDFYKPRIVA